jgi:hypothetical protein
MGNIFKWLKGKKKNNIYAKTNEYTYYISNIALLSDAFPSYKFPLVENNTFRIIQMNILINALKNKNIIEETLDKCIHELNPINITTEEKNLYIRNHIWKELDLHNSPYFIIDRARIYIPLYSQGLNLIYNDECSKLFEYPYNQLKNDPSTAAIDLFDVYNYALYDSKFTHLIKIKEDKSSAAFYHPEFETIYIINDQGRLDIAIDLFDRHIKNINSDDIIKRVEDVVENFYSNDRKKFIKSLYKNQFISEKIYRKLSHKVSIRIIKKGRLVQKGKTPDEVL